VDGIDRIRALELAAFACWPALEEKSEQGWVLRFGGGHTKRANSANPLQPDGAAPIAAIEAEYRDRGLTPVFRLTPLADLERTDALLEKHGYRLVEPSRVLVLEDLAALTRPGVPAGLTLRLDTTPSAAWCAANEQLRACPPEQRQARDAILHKIAVPAVFASLYDGETPLALAIGAVAGRWFDLNAVATRPEARGRGLMRALIGEMAAWGRAQGASAGHLAVVAGNAPAERLYEGLGYREAYRYQYRVGSR
jgi:GNAT superfamily N-acetyltransferase